MRGLFELDDGSVVHIHHLQLSFAVDALAHHHLAPLIRDRGTHLLGVALHLARLHVARLAQSVERETADANV